LLTHSDIIIAKKGFLMKKLLEELDPIGINVDWWKRITGHVDIIKFIFGQSVPENIGLDTSFLHSKE
jgi:hypothetical protein